MVAKPEIIFWVTKKMVSAIRKIFSFEKTIVCVMHSIFTTTRSTVMVAKKMVSFAKTVLSAAGKPRDWNKGWYFSD
jgi:hypothetical protein